MGLCEMYRALRNRLFGIIACLCWGMGAAGAACALYFVARPGPRVPQLLELAVGVAVKAFFAAGLWGIVGIRIDQPRIVAVFSTIGAVLALLGLELAYPGAWALLTKRF